MASGRQLRYLDRMPDERGQDSTPAIRPLTVTINGWWRACAVALGLACLGSGGVAVFVTHLEAGPVALLAVGLVLLLIGAGGRLPSRLKVGESEATWEAVEGFAKKMDEVVPTERTAQLVDALKALAPAAPAVAAAGLDAVAERQQYERMVTEMLSEAVQEINRSMGEKQKARLDLRLDYRTEAGARLDAVVAGPAGDYLAVEVQHLTHKVTTTEVLSAVRKAVSLARELQNPQLDEESRAVKLLLISNQELHGAWVTGSLDPYFSPFKVYFQPVRVISKTDLPKVVEAIRAEFGIPTLGALSGKPEDM